MNREDLTDALLKLIEERHFYKMVGLLYRVAALHRQIGAEGYELAVAGDYRQAFHALKRQPRRLQQGMESVRVYYLLALYAEQLLEREDAKVYFAMAYRQLYGVFHEREQRYGPDWVIFADYRREVHFFDTMTQLEDWEVKAAASLFYKGNPPLPGYLKDQFEQHVFKPPEKPQNRPAPVSRSFLPFNWLRRS